VNSLCGNGSFSSSNVPVSTRVNSTTSSGIQKNFKTRFYDVDLTGGLGGAQGG